uniref:DDE_Tnp_IS1595 domain-containing protein n=1 Tax=Ascaris lumbricoides TaxID=6252 RepID=A0A0M3HQ82_ASCLU
MFRAVERGTASAVLFVAADGTRTTLEALRAQRVLPGSVLVSDVWTTYNELGASKSSDLLQCIFADSTLQNIRNSSKDEKNCSALSARPMITDTSTRRSWTTVNPSAPALPRLRRYEAIPRGSWRLCPRSQRRGHIIP